ncbi:hypothetical protein AmaxDRAFT_5010 [Limnospira maxima CS-328]|uniref:Uncharacterized protein n=1 Tax=Limnospira maxima CS-328 TaxID=513049 RepID=B5W8B0_LIMMA|nr:hypothetical protein AmaxDRAFT_5010 [Limnospira maxima CS-328]
MLQKISSGGGGLRFAGACGIILNNGNSDNF